MQPLGATVGHGAPAGRRNHHCELVSLPCTSGVPAAPRELGRGRAGGGGRLGAKPRLWEGEEGEAEPRGCLGREAGKEGRGTQASQETEGPPGGERPGPRPSSAGEGQALRVHAQSPQTHWTEQTHTQHTEMRRGTHREAGGHTQERVVLCFVPGIELRALHHWATSRPFSVFY